MRWLSQLFNIKLTFKVNQKEKKTLKKGSRHVEFPYPKKKKQKEKKKKKKEKREREGGGGWGAASLRLKCRKAQRV